MGEIEDTIYSYPVLWDSNLFVSILGSNCDCNCSSFEHRSWTPGLHITLQKLMPTGHSTLSHSPIAQCRTRPVNKGSKSSNTVGAHSKINCDKKRKQPRWIEIKNDGWVMWLYIGLRREDIYERPWRSGVSNSPSLSWEAMADGPGGFHYKSSATLFTQHLQCRLKISFFPKQRISQLSYSSPSCYVLQAVHAHSPSHSDPFHGLVPEW